MLASQHQQGVSRLDKAGWEHGLTPILLKRLRILIKPFDTARPKAEPQAIAARLEAIATAVAFDGERGPAVRSVARCLVRAFSVPPELALSLVECWNEQHCSPPLPRDQVKNIFNNLAMREAENVRARRVRR